MIAEHEYKVPDRIAGYEAVAELRKCCKGREFRFVLVNVTYAVRPYGRGYSSCRYVTADGALFRLSRQPFGLIEEGTGQSLARRATSDELIGRNIWRIGPRSWI